MSMEIPSSNPSFDDKTMNDAIALGQAIAQTVAMARKLIDSGRAVDLTGLDRGIGLLCAKSLDLPPELGRDIRPRLTSVLHELDEMTTALRRQNTGG
jgi:hypothetical protein